jgi:HD-like signal output (HDOD) protein
VGLLALDRVAGLRQPPPRRGEVPVLDWEQINFGSTNAAVASRVLRSWKFPESLAAIVSGRYSPEAAGDQRSAASVLHLASCIAERLGAGIEAEKGLFPSLPERIAAAGLPWEEFSETIIEAAENLNRTRALLRLA